jgi:hypothetical protein
VLDFDRVIQEMTGIRSPFLEVWAVAFVGPDDMKVVRVAPAALSVDLKIRASLEEAKKQTPFINRGIRGTGTEPRTLGQPICPLRG